MCWDYDAGEPYSDKKHGWDEEYAGVKVERYGKRSLRVARCPRDIDPHSARAILNSGVALLRKNDLEVIPVSETKDFPYRIYAVHDGVPYEARPTNAHAFHGCPVLPEKFDELPSQLRKLLREQAKAQGHDLDTWLSDWREP